MDIPGGEKRVIQGGQDTGCILAEVLPLIFNNAPVRVWEIGSG